MLPRQDEHMAVGHPGYVVVVVCGVIGESVTPVELALPAEHLDAATHAPPREHRTGLARSAKQSAVLEEIG